MTAKICRPFAVARSLSFDTVSATEWGLSLVVTPPLSAPATDASVDKRLVDELAQLRADWMRARGKQLGEEGSGDLFYGVDPEGGAGGTSPGIGSRHREHAVGGRVEDDREPQTEPHAVIGGLGKQRPADLFEVCTTGKVILGHVSDGARTEEARVVEDAAIEQHLGKPVVVVRGRDQPSPTRRCVRGSERQLPQCRSRFGLAVRPGHV